MAEKIKLPQSWRHGLPGALMAKPLEAIGASVVQSHRGWHGGIRRRRDRGSGDAGDVAVYGGRTSGLRHRRKIPKWSVPVQRLCGSFRSSTRESSCASSDGEGVGPLASAECLGQVGLPGLGLVRPPVVGRSPAFVSNSELKAGDTRHKLTGIVAGPVGVGRHRGFSPRETLCVAPADHSHICCCCCCLFFFGGGDQ